MLNFSQVSASVEILPKKNQTNQNSTKMSTYLLIWDLNPNYITEDHAKRAGQWKHLMQMVEEDMKKGVMKDWGSFIAERGGYCIAEGSEIDVGLLAQRYVPYVEFKTHACASVDQTRQLLETMVGQMEAV